MRIKKKEKRLILELSFFEFLLALKRSLMIPIEKIQSIKRKPYKSFGIRFPGTFVPFIVKAGTYYIRKNGKWEKEFWLRTTGGMPLVIETKDWDYDRVVLALPELDKIEKQIIEIVGS